MCPYVSMYQSKKKQLHFPEKKGCFPNPTKDTVNDIV